MGFPFNSSCPTNNQPPKSSWVLATDVAPHALALTIANSQINNVTVNTAIMNHFDNSSIVNVMNKFTKDDEGGFSLVFGSSLQDLFQTTTTDSSSSNTTIAPLWQTLNQLLDKNNPNSLVILGHSRFDQLEVPQEEGSWELITRISGSHSFFGNMQTRDGNLSDFELSVLKPKEVVVVKEEIVQCHE